MQELMSRVGVKRVKGHMCAHNMYIDDPAGRALAFKPTGWLSNSACILEQLGVQCTNLQNNPGFYKHRHADLQGGRAARAAIYPEQLCYAILKGLRNQLKHLGLNNIGEVGSICEDFSEHLFLQEVQHYTHEVYDDLSGKVLDSSLVSQARADEVKGAEAHNVWTKVSIDECFKTTGKKPIGGRWVDVNKGDSVHPE